MAVHDSLHLNQHRTRTDHLQYFRVPYHLRVDLLGFREAKVELSRNSVACLIGCAFPLPSVSGFCLWASIPPEYTSSP